MPEVVELDPSVLGTRAYWDDVYAREVRNFAAHAADEGEVWFGEESEDRIVEYLDRHFRSDRSSSHSDESESGAELGTEQLRVLDLGTGNGHLLFTLHEQGYAHWRLHGIDYSAASVDLARAVARHRGLEQITFAVADFITRPYVYERDHEGGYEHEREHGQEHEQDGWDIVLDKGTFDAICLSDERLGDGRTLAQAYPGRVHDLLKPGGTLLVTSCNWTHDELVGKLTVGGKLVHTGQVKRPSFTFGGQTGSTLATVAFKRAGSQ